MSLVQLMGGSLLERLQQWVCGRLAGCTIQYEWRRLTGGAKLGDGDWATP